MNATRLLQFSRQFGAYCGRRFAPLSQRYHLSMREIDVLLFLANNPCYDTARDITEYRGISKSQVSQAVELLAAEGILRRAVDEEDRRVVHLSVTEDGAPLARECQEIQTACGKRLLEGLSPTQQAQFSALLETVLANGEHLAEEAMS